MTPPAIIRGKVYVLGDNIDTDQIIPAQYLNLVPTIPEEYRELGAHAFAGLPEDCPAFIENGKETAEYAIIVAGKNFGCGSSREHAPICLGAAGIRAVVAESYARIFFRNAVATGELYPLESSIAVADKFHTGDEAEINMDTSELVNVSSGERFSLNPLGAVAPVIEAGGIFAYARSVGMIEPADGPTGSTEDEAESEQHQEQEAPDSWRSSEETVRIEAPTNEEPISYKPSKTRVVAVTNQKGGVGKTTTVINLAACLAELNKRILVIDLDPQANATSGLGLPPQEGTSLYHSLLGPSEVGALPKKTVVKKVDIIPSEIDLAGSEVEVARMDGYLHCFQRAIAPIVEAGRYDFILIDCPPSLGILTMKALSAAHSLLIPMQCESYALEGLPVISRLIEQLQESGANPDVDIAGILMTMYDTRIRLASAVVKEVRRHFGPKVYRSIIPRNVRLSEAPSHGKPITLYDSRSTGARAYRKLAKEFVKRMKGKKRRR